MTPKEITIVIDGGEEEFKAKYISYSEMYQAALYEMEDGREFYVEPAYIQECKSSGKPVDIPEAVITQRERMLAKLAWGQAQLDRMQKQDQSGLILPDGLPQ